MAESVPDSGGYVRDLLPADAASLRLILSGESIIDWPWLEFASMQEIDDFVRVHGFDLGLPQDVQHVQYLHQEAVSYLSDILEYRIPDEIKHVPDVRKLLFWASHKKGARKYRTYACIVLKVMHIIHHLLARELLYHAALSEAHLSDLLTQKVFAFVDMMRSQGIQVVEYAGGRKTRHSLVTKLLAKRETIASQIFDKTRFRIVLKKQDDLLAALVLMTHQLFPFNYAIPSQSENALIDLDLIAETPAIPARVKSILLGQKHLGAPQLKNEFSGKSYKSINFVVDVPIRIDQYLKGFQPPLEPTLGHIVFILAEFQLLDQDTAERNESGDNSHVRYKSRQEERVRTRLEASFDLDE